MGDFEEENGSEYSIQGQKQKARLTAATMLIIGLFAPLMITMYNFGWSSDIAMQSIFWMYSQSSYMSNFYGFSLIPFYALASMFPFILLRMVPVLQINKYYNGKTTRKRAFIASFVGDGFFLFMGLPTLFMSIFLPSFYLMIPLPLQLIVAILVLWRSPLLEPTTPWKSEEKPKSWWEKTPDSQQKKSDDDDDQLW